MLKNSLTYIYISILIVFIYVFQIFFINDKLLFGVKPNLILIFCIVVSLFTGLYKGAVCSFFIGLFTDILFGNSFGIFTISYTVTGTLIGYINSNYRKENKMSLVYVTIIATCIFELTEYISYLIYTRIYSNIFYLIKQILISSILNIVIVYIIYSLIYKVTEYFQDRLKINSYF